jgi:hypothetical protein
MPDVSLSFSYPDQIPAAAAGRRNMAGPRFPPAGLKRYGSYPHQGSRHATKRPAMIDVHYWTTPNGHKVTIFLEEAGLQYKIIPVNIGKGEQFKAEFLTVSPNNRIPRHCRSRTR